MDLAGSAGSGAFGNKQEERLGGSLDDLSPAEDHRDILVSSEGVTCKPY